MVPTLVENSKCFRVLVNITINLFCAKPLHKQLKSMHKVVSHWLIEFPLDKTHSSNKNIMSSETRQHYRNENIVTEMKICALMISEARTCLRVEHVSLS